MHRAYRIPFALFAAAALLLTAMGPSHAGEVPRMNIDELKAMLEEPELVILDVRRGKDWSSSEFKIKGATYVGSQAYVSWAGTYAKDQKIVLYCA